MKDARPEEREEATDRWFGFLEVIHRLAMRKLKLEKEQRKNHHPPSSQTSDGDVQQLNLFEVRSD